MPTTPTTRLQALRQLMAKKGVDAIIVPSADPHMSEYLPEYWQGRAWLSGFTGSVGTLVVLHKTAYLWADSRYWLQADKQLQGSGIMLKKIGVDADYVDFLSQTLPKDATIAIDGASVSLNHYDQLATAFHHIVTDDLLEKIWENRPSLPTASIYPHNPAFVFCSSPEKLTQIRKQMMASHADYHLVSSLDDIAWITNLRGADVPCNPVFLAHLLLGVDSAVLYVDEQKLDDNIKALLKNANISTKDYKAVADDLVNLSGALLIDPNKVAIGTLQTLPKTVTLVKKTNPSTLLKAIKSEQELACIRRAMRQDGIALCEFFADFEQQLADGVVLNEVDVDTLLTKARARQPNFISPSFDSIVGFRGNGAIVHYRAEPDSCATITGDGLLLIDSGAQYQNGTTDITRMVGVGSILAQAKTDVTYVLKAHIALAQAVFPVGVSSVAIDVLARLPMWQAGLDYGHGTGHGVGYFLNVHEDPQVIAYSAQSCSERVLKEGMVTSNEPGLYRTDQWGIRLENLVACVADKTTEFGEFLKFDDLTLCPFDTRLIVPELLNDQEKTWLNNYHKKVYDALIDGVSGSAKTWLIERTQAI